MSTFDKYSSKKKQLKFCCSYFNKISPQLLYVWLKIVLLERFDLKDCEGLQNNGDHRLMLCFVNEMKLMLSYVQFYCFCLFFWGVGGDVGRRLGVAQTHLLFMSMARGCVAVLINACWGLKLPFMPQDIWDGFHLWSTERTGALTPAAGDLWKRAAFCREMALNVTPWSRAGIKSRGYCAPVHHAPPYT